MTSTTIPSLHGRATVNLSQAQAFAFFTESMTRWWPAEHHIGAAEMTDLILESRPGGRWYERGSDGSECDWGRVLSWEPPGRLVVTWQINGSWQYDDDMSHASEVEITFRPDGPNRTVVELEHRHLDRLVDGQALHDGIAEGGGGWSTTLERFAKVAETSQ